MSATMSERSPSPLASAEDLPVEAACAAIAAALTPVTETETLPLSAALGRTLAADVASPIDVPAHDNAAMDGYALHGADLLPEGETVLQVLPGTAFAGRPWAGAVPRGACLRIMTGAVVPPGLDTVVPHELASLDGDRLYMRAGAVRPGDHRRRRGEDLAAGATALAAGRRLRPADLGLLASLGLAEVTVVRRLRVALFSTGDEVVAPGRPLPPGAVYDSNRFALAAALQRPGFELRDLGIVGDDPAALEAVLREAAGWADAVVTSGGVSMGDADHTREILSRLGDVAFWKVAMRPGRPFAFGPLWNTRPGARPALLFALPGNPVAAQVAFQVFARPALAVLGGARPEPPLRLPARSASTFRKRPGRTEFPRGIVERGPDGAWQVRSTGDQGAGLLHSLVQANVLVVLPHDRGPVAPGEMVEVWPLDDLA